MATKRLRIDRIKKRSWVKANNEDDVSSVHQQGLRAMEERIKNSRRVPPEINSSFLDLYNVHLIEFVRKMDDGSFKACHFPKKATHRLEATSWNKEPTVNFKSKAWACSVCAIPINAYLRPTNIKVKKPFPSNITAYNSKGAIVGKRNVLLYVIKAMEAKVNKVAVSKMLHEECDQLYRNLIRASRILAQRKGYRRIKLSTPFSLT